MDPDQTAPIGAVCSGSTLLASILKFISNVRQLFAADDFSRRHFQMHFSLGALRVNSLCASMIGSRKKSVFSFNPNNVFKDLIHIVNWMLPIMEGIIRHNSLHTC